jgi:hypothetical protein
MFTMRLRVAENCFMKPVEQAQLFLAKAAEDESLLDAVLHLPGLNSDQ